MNFFFFLRQRNIAFSSLGPRELTFPCHTRQQALRQPHGHTLSRVPAFSHIPSAFCTQTIQLSNFLIRDDHQSHLDERHILRSANLVKRLQEVPGKIPSLPKREVRGKGGFQSTDSASPQKAMSLLSPCPPLTLVWRVGCLRAAELLEWSFQWAVRNGSRSEQRTAGPSSLFSHLGPWTLMLFCHMHLQSLNTVLELSQ